MVRRRGRKLRAGWHIFTESGEIHGKELSVKAAGGKVQKQCIQSRPG
jgi:hypothetical protein